MAWAADESPNVPGDDFDVLPYKWETNVAHAKLRPVFPKNVDEPIVQARHLAGKHTLPYTAHCANAAAACQ
jgi:hypothetical protein